MIFGGIVIYTGGKQMGDWVQINRYEFEEALREDEKSKLHIESFKGYKARHCFIFCTWRPQNCSCIQKFKEINGK